MSSEQADAVIDLLISMQSQQLQIMDYCEWLHRCVVGYGLILVPAIITVLFGWWILRQYL